MTWGDTIEYPDFTDCFQNTILIYFPCGLLFLLLPFYLPSLWRKDLGPIQPSCLNVSRMVGRYFILNNMFDKYFVKKHILALLAALCSLLSVMRTIDDEVAGKEPPVALYVSPVIQLITTV